MQITFSHGETHTTATANEIHEAATAASIMGAEQVEFTLNVIWFHFKGLDAIKAVPRPAANRKVDFNHRYMIQNIIEDLMVRVKKNA